MTRSARSISAGAALVALLAVVAFAASARRPAVGDGEARTISGGVLDVVFTLGLLGLLLTAGLLVWGIRFRRDDERLDLRGLLLALAVVVAFFLAVALGAYLLSDREHGARPRGSVPSLTAPAGGVTSGTARRDAPRAQDGRISWPTVFAGVGGVLAVAGAISGRLWWSQRQRVRGRRAAADAVREVLQQALAGLDGSDPRAAVIAAYAHMERTLAVHGLPRDPAEAPHEYMERALAELRASRSSIHDLTELFERAKFSEHAIGERERNVAIAALTAVRDELAQEIV